MFNYGSTYFRLRILICLLELCVISYASIYFGLVAFIMVV
jgi:hypothetical protein